MKNDLQKAGQFIKQVFKSPVAYLGGLVFYYFFYILLIVLADFSVVSIRYFIEPFVFFYGSLVDGLWFQDWILTLSLFAAFFGGMVIFHGLKKQQHWAWITYFILLASKMALVILATYNFAFWLFAFSDCGCGSASDSCHRCLSAHDNPGAIYSLILIFLLLLVGFIFLYKKRNQYDIKSNLYTIIFWLFNSGFLISIILIILYLYSLDTKDSILLGG
jgi:hypothetical protein